MSIINLASLAASTPVATHATGTAATQAPLIMKTDTTKTTADVTKPAVVTPTVKLNQYGAPELTEKQIEEELK